jgi:hypothetical protein
MTEKDFISQLKTLKEIRPQSSWLKSNREILLAQVSNSGAETLSPWQKLLIDVRSFSLILSKPVGVLAAMFMFLTGTAAFGHLALSQAKPDDSLYIARIISEKAKLSTVFNTEAKERMEAQFAASHVEAITEALAKVNLEENVNEDKVARLNDSFNREINIVRTKMVVMSNRGSAQVNNISNEVVDTQLEVLVNDDDLLQVADNNKEEQGTQLLINEKIETEIKASATNTPDITDKPAANQTEEEKNKKIAEAELASVIKDVKDPKAMLEEVQVLFDAKDYQGALEKIREVKKMIK